MIAVFNASKQKKKRRVIPAFLHFMCCAARIKKQLLLPLVLRLPQRLQLLLLQL